MITVHVDDSAFREYLGRLQGRLGDMSEPMAAAMTE